MGGDITPLCASGQKMGGDCIFFFFFIITLKP
jgi:hypothetical protein